MARNSAGTHSLPLANVVSGTAITPTWANSTLADLSTEMTDSLSRSGKGGMTAPLRTADGTVAAPAMSFTSETGTGWYRSAAGVMRAAILGVYRLLLNATGVQVNGTLDVSGNTVLTGTTTSTGALTATAGIVMNAAGTGSGQWTRGNLPTVGQQESSSSGSWSTVSASYVDVTNLSVTITTTGRPVLVMVQPESSATQEGYLQSEGTADATASFFTITRGGTRIRSTGVAVSSTSSGGNPTVCTIPPNGLMVMDPVAAGTYTYKLQAKRYNATDTAKVLYCTLVAFEL